MKPIPENSIDLSELNCMLYRNSINSVILEKRSKLIFINNIIPKLQQSRRQQLPLQLLSMKQNHLCRLLLQSQLHNQDH
jgi:hypothetical protein